MTFRLSLAAVAWIVSAALVSGESLGEAAEREKQRKKAGGAKVFTDDDLTKDKPRPRPTPRATGDRARGAAPAAAATPTETPTPADPAVAAAAESSQRISAARDAVTAARADVDRAQRAVDDAMSPFHPVYPRGFGSPELPRLQEALTAAKEKLAAAEKALAEVSSAPPSDGR
jgi:hypothetical protein